MKVGVSTACLYPKPLEESLYELAVNGISCTEIFVNTHSELKKSFVHSLRSMINRFEMTCPSLHPFTCELEQLMFFSDYERRFNDIMEYYKLYFHCMNVLGAEIFVFHGGKADRGREFYCERYSKLYQLGKEFGVTVAIENVSRCQSASSAFIRDIARILGNECAFVIDTKQAIRAGENPFSFLDAAGSRTVHVHISDSGELGDCLPVGRGRFRFKQFFEKLNKLNPDASVILELYRSSFGGISDLVSSYNILNKMIDSIDNSEVKTI